MNRESYDATDISGNGIFPDDQVPAFRKDITKVKYDHELPLQLVFQLRIY